MSANRSSPSLLLVTSALFLSIVIFAAPAWADIEAGMEAYGRGDYATALREWRPLAERGHAGAQYNLGMLYDFRKGVPQDFAMARQWYEKAAAQGHAGAQNNLGGLYEFGHGVTRNDVLAYMWYDIAAHSTDDTWRDVAAENRDEIADGMTSAQIAEAKKKAKEWKPNAQRPANVP
ncbi:MAG TPA: tetratricopeptide repeat protein [Nitrospiraceae bacterium]|nr:tetratricopeptide repeat protein [Nitrospiraceae bacterium]